MDLPSAKRQYSNEEKRQLIANLDIEVAHRTRQFEAWLADRLENFTIHQEGQVSRIPKQVRSMTLREFGTKYEGNIQLALRGFQKERLAAAGADATLGEIDKSMRKRKWVASQETEAEVPGSSQSKETDSHHTFKNARTVPPSPQKVAGSSTGPGTAQRSRLLSNTNKTPGAVCVRTMGRAPSPQKSRPPFNNTTSTYNPRPPSRLASPLKHAASNPNISIQAPQNRLPSNSSFNPSLPPKTPILPTHRADQHNTTMRLPRKDENMLSVNGSPLANPYEFGLGWFKGVEMAQMDSEDDEISDERDAQNSGLNGGHTLKRSKSSIIIRRDPSVAFSANLNGLHSRTDSQASFYTASSQTTSSSHSRENSQAAVLVGPQPQSNLEAFRFPTTKPNNSEATPRPLFKHTRSFSALVAIPTKDGHLLEFDPLQTSPGALDALEGITDSAKKQAKVEMGRLIQATVDKWKIR
ncbi:hypothetical protein GALMADRAFT_58145 [Galerina marginata CBS 339.88]|uniref:Borealin N-terminal domain-containing protein n=1 Tax=Galerina marginata (strain CBS 339.88) TaxID=685588 RepID=A0A067THV7_GALM3|nr:hypothetical protein GALMADRAFT_58145 [Galerina marginata CBS 339.88]